MSCNVLDLGGECLVPADACPSVLDPVCGCDGVTYGNDCERQRARAQLDHRGGCG
jgi:Kazal-type serine protease inhibitor domain